MGIVDSIMNRFGYASKKQMESQISEAVKRELDFKIPNWLGETADAFRWNMPDPTIYATQADLYRLSPILGTAMDILSNDVGTSKFNVERMVGEETREIPNHEFEELLRNPNPADSGIEFIQATVDSYKLNGNHIWWLNRADRFSVPSEMWPIAYSAVMPVPDRNLYIEYYEYYPGNGNVMRLETWEVVHFKTYNPDNRFIGLSPLESLIQTIRGDLAMRKTNTVNYAEYGGAPQSILAFKDFVGEPNWTNIKDEARTAARKNQMMMLRGVGDGVSWLQRGISNKDMDFVAGLKQNMTDVFNRMCPGLLAMLSESATEANALAARATYSEKTLWPMMEVIAQKITADILPAYGRKLIGHFTDPRVVDRKLQLEEQTAYERTHTLDETRRKYYKDDPIGDDRGDELVAQVGPISQPEPSQPPQIITQVRNTQPPEIAPGSQQADEVAVKAIEELQKWRRMALQGKSKSRTFKTVVIPRATAENIRSKLGTLDDKEHINAVFDGAIKAIQRANRSQLDILEGIRLGVQALESRR